MKTRFALLGLILGAFLLLPLTATALFGAHSFAQKGEALKEIMTLIEKASFYKLSEKELKDVQECIAGRAFLSFEVKKETQLKEDFKVPSCFPQDKRARYFSPKMARILDTDMKGHFGGIGIQIEVDKDTGGVLVKKILSDEPAEKDGRIKVGDVISAAGDFVEGKETKMVPFKGLDLGSAVEVIRGAPGKKVSLEVWRGGQKLPLIIIAREDVKIKSVESRQINPGIGYLKISSFMDYGATKEFFDEAEKFNQKGVKNLVIDLRGNSGGLMKTAAVIAAFFAPQLGDLILEVRGRRSGVGDGNKILAPETGPFAGLKVVVLIDGLSASASEILAGSLKIWGAKIVGVKSFGKGSIQTILPLSDGGRFSLTTALYYLADGKTPEDGGIEPDFKVEDDPRTPDIDEALIAATGILMN